MSGISTHILDVSRGLPAPDVAVRLEYQSEAEWHLLQENYTDADGRIKFSLEDFQLGNYRLTFELEPYFAASDVQGFYPYVQITFAVRDARHYHVPLLLSPFGYSTYRGS